MRATLLIALLGLFGALSAATDPPAAAAPIDWQDAIHQLRGEREKAVTCLTQLRKHKDAYLIAQGELFYAAAKAQMDQTHSFLRDALAGKTTDDDTTALDAQIEQAIEARLKLCHLLDQNKPDSAIEKDILVAVLESSFEPTKAAAQALFEQRTSEQAKPNIETQLEAAQWSEAARLPQPTDGLDAETEEAVVYPVWFGTNRQRGPDHSDRFTDAVDGRVTFTEGRDERITYGRAEVLIPAAHRFGETGTSFIKKVFRLDLRDDRLRLQQVSIQDQGAWVAELRQKLAAAKAPGGPTHALVFLHGYNVRFEAAAIQAAQIGFDLKVPGATAFFSWPSKGRLLGYPADEATIEASEAAIAEFLVTFARGVDADQVHLVAHSMGNRGLLRALQRIAADAETRSDVRFGQIFLAAPDLDRGLFLDLARLYPQFSERTTLYASKGDLAVLASRVLHAAPRAGYFKPYTVAPGIDTVAVPDFNLDVLGHGYFAQAEALLHDIRSLMLHNEAPGLRLRLESATEDDQSFWRMRP